MVQIPRVEIGKWVDHLALSGTSFENTFGSRKAEIVGNEIWLTDDSNIVAKRSIEEAPDQWWGGRCYQTICFSSDGRCLWHLGYKNNIAQLMLLDGLNLKVVDTVHPVTMIQFESEAGVLAEWYEPETRASEMLPDVLLTYGNAGDDFIYLLIFQATANGIRDLTGEKLIGTVGDKLDERLFSANFVSPSHLLIIDDLGEMTLFEWPSLEQTATYSITAGLTNRKNDEIEVWPEDTDKDPWVSPGWEVGVMGDILLVNIRDAHPPALRGLIAFEKDSLVPLGMVRPPMAVKYDLTYLGDSKFGTPHNEQLHTWRLILSEKS